MRAVFNFIKTTALGGLVVVVPLAILIYLLANVYHQVNSLAVLIADKIPYPIFGHPAVLLAMTLLAITALCFLIGLVLQTRYFGQLLQKLNDILDKKVPMFGAIRSITQRFTGISGAEFSTVEVDLYGSGTRTIGFLVETLSDGRVCVFIPSVPAVTVGQLHIMPKSSIREISTNPKDAINALTQWGVGMQDLYNEKT
jgi:uncharacterized membrane protein